MGRGHVSPDSVFIYSQGDHVFLIIVLNITLPGSLQHAQTVFPRLEEVYPPLRLLYE